MQTVRGPSVCVLKLTRCRPNPHVTVSGGGGLRAGLAVRGPQACDRRPYVRNPESPLPTAAAEGTARSQTL